MLIRFMKEDFTVCQIGDLQQVNLDMPYCFLAKTAHELSLVCRSEDVPEKALKREDGWQAFYIEGSLDFALTGILAGIADVLTKKGISLLALSTYDTDYILVKKEKMAQALQTLEEAGYTIMSDK